MNTYWKNFEPEVLATFCPYLQEFCLGQNYAKMLQTKSFPVLLGEIESGKHDDEIQNWWNEISGGERDIIISHGLIFTSMKIAQLSDKRRLFRDRLEELGYDVSKAKKAKLTA